MPGLSVDEFEPLDRFDLIPISNSCDAERGFYLEVLPLAFACKILTALYLSY